VGRVAVSTVAVVALLAGGAAVLAVTAPSPAGGATSSSGGSSAEGVVTLAGTGRPGYSGDGGPARSAALDTPDGLTVDAAGDLFVADSGNCRIRELTVAGGQTFGRHSDPNTIVTVAGGPCGRPGDPAPAALATDRAGDLFVAFPSANRVEVLAPRAGSVLGTTVTADRLTAVVGTGAAGDGGDGGRPTDALLDSPSGLATDAAGDLFVADTANCRVRKVAASGASAGEITTVAGTGVCGSSGDGGPATAAQVWDPGALVADSAGDLFVADQGNRTVRVLAAQATTVLGTTVGAGDLATVAGEGSYGPYLTDGLVANGQTGELNFPEGLALDAAGNLLVADGASHVIREVTAAPGTLHGQPVAAGVMVTVAGATATDVTHTHTAWVRTSMADPVGLVVGPHGRIVFADHDADNVRALTPAG
jgi:sugar lactone lactonase YvrE